MPIHPDSIPTSEQVRETLLDRIYYPYKKQILAAATIAAVAVLAILAVRDHRVRRLEEQWARYAAAFEAGSDARDSGDPDAVRRGAEERITLLRRLVQDFPADPVTPFALTAVVSAQVEAQRYDDALVTLDEVRKRFPDFALATEQADLGPEGKARSLAERLESGIRAEMKWAAETKYTHPAPSTATMALVETTAGNFWMGFYEEQAPEHVAQFKKLVREGWFNGTQVYHARQGGTPEQPTPMLFELGSAASKVGGPEWDPNPSNHDRDEPGVTIEPEDARFLVHHVRGVVSAVMMPSGESPRRFMVVAAANGLPRYDNQNTPFAAVLMDREQSGSVIDRISLVPTYGTAPETREDQDAFGMRDHPYPPVWVRRVTLWREEKLESGHGWDASRAGSPEPEPWEATLPPPPKPADFAPKRDEPKDAPEKKDEGATEKAPGAPPAAAPTDEPAK